MLDKSGLGVITRRKDDYEAACLFAAGEFADKDGLYWV